jgi:DNA repair exonuclease SbcCD ATPase subunit
MQIYALKFNNFLRFGEVDNTIVFDLTPQQKADLLNGTITMDSIYESVAKDPFGHINAVKSRGIEKQIGIMGIINGDSDSSNGAGKSSLLEGICYAHYEKIVRKTANNDKIEKAGLSVVTKLDGKYPANLKDSYVEEYFEENGSIYRLKRGRTFSKNQSSSQPLLEFECINESSVDSRSGHRTGDTKDSISDVITMDYDVFVNSQMFGQSDAGKYLTGTDKTKKEMLISLLRLEKVVDGCLELIRKKKNAQEKVVNEISSRIKFIEDMFAQGVTKYCDPKDNSSSEEYPQRILDVLKLTVQEGKDKLDKCDTKKLELQASIDLLLKDDRITKASKIKEEGLRKKDEKVTKEKEKKQRIDEWETLQKASIKDICDINNDIANKTKRMASVKESITSLKAKVEAFDGEKCKKQLEIINKAKDKQPSVKDMSIKLNLEREELVKDIATLTSNKKDLNLENNELKTQIANVKDGDNFICEKCKSKVTKEHILSEIEINAKKMVVIDSQVEEITKRKVSIEKDISEINEKTEKINKYILAEPKILGEIETNKALHNNIVTVNQNFVDLEAEMADLNKRLKISNDKVKEYGLKITNISSEFDIDIKSIEDKMVQLRLDYDKASNEAKIVEQEIKQVKETIVKIDEVKNSTSEKLGFLEREIAHFNQLKDSLVEKRAEYIVESKDFHRYGLLESVYGLEGIQTRIVNRYLPLLNAYTKEFLDILSRGTIIVDQTINDRSKIDMNIYGGSADTYEMLSGGEKMIVRLAVDIGLSLLSFSRSSQKPEIICLDEIFGQLDKSNTDSVFEMLDKLQDKFSRLLIITHDPKIQARIKSNIIIEKNAGTLGLSAIKRIE